MTTTERHGAAADAGAAARYDDDGEFRGWGKVAFFLAVMVSVFVSAFVIGRLTGPEAPGAERPRIPAPSQVYGGGSGGVGGGETQGDADTETEEDGGRHGHK